MSKIIGIDLGTTNSVVSVMDGGQPTIITNEEGNRTTPSVVAQTSSGERLVGQVAKRQAVTNPKDTIYSIKRFIGTNFKSSKDIKDVPYEVTAGKSGECLITLGGKKQAPQEISAAILGKLKTAAENFLGTEVSEAVITVPAYFNDEQRQATKDAGKIAGLEVKRIINEPTAAALAYGVDNDKDKKIVVFDFGGGTFDVSVLDISNEVVEVLSTNGNTHLGGDDVDNAIIKWIGKEFKKDSGIDIASDPMVLQRIKEAAEKAKVELSSVGETDINLPFLTANEAGPIHLNLKLTRAKFDRLIASTVKKLFKSVDKAMTDAKLDKGDIDDVLLVGGSTRIGNGCRLFSFASIGQQPQDLKFHGEKTRLIIGKNNKIREHVTINPGTKGGGGLTKIGNNCLFMVASHIAHDCIISNNVIMANNATLGGHVKIDEFAIIGGLSAVHQFVRIGKHAMIGGMSGVENDVIPFGSVVGNRAHLSGLNIIGLKRRGFNRKQIHDLRTAFRLIFSIEGTEFERLKDAIKIYKKNKVVMDIVRFIKNKSSRANRQKFTAIT